MSRQQLCIDHGPMGDLTGTKEKKKKRIDENREVLKLTAQYIKLKIKTNSTFR